LSAQKLSDNLFNGQRILVVEDEPEIQEISAYEFSSRGANVVTAEGANDALKILAREKIDFIVSDFLMPKGSGLDLMKGLKTEGIKVPLVILTGFSDLTRDEVLKMGALEMFYKPIKWPILLEFVKNSLDSKSGS
jgi:DNA-binding NtrC family response regulator